MPLLSGLALQISEDLEVRFPEQRKTQRNKLAVLVATLLEVASGEVMELAHSLPLKSTNSMTRFQWIKRFLGNDLVKVDEVMGCYSRDILQKIHDRGDQIDLILDQSTLQTFVRHELVMVALRVGKRAIPICWRVYEASGSLGWQQQQEVLELAKSLVPEGARVRLMGDRFYGHSEMINWCSKAGWDYFLRLKASLLISYDQDAWREDMKSLSACYEDNEHILSDVYLTQHKVRTNIQMIKNDDASEPWIIAMSCEPSKKAALEYAKRWGIEAMFSDLKTRGFNINDSQLRKTDRIDRLIMVMAIALYWSVSTGLWQAVEECKKKSKSITEAWFQSSIKGAD